MALCTKCGAVIHDEDTNSHVCNPINVPTKGTEKIPNTSTVNK